MNGSFLALVILYIIKTKLSLRVLVKQLDLLTLLILLLSNPHQVGDLLA